jgi:hypothetical protein
MSQNEYVFAKAARGLDEIGYVVRKSSAGGSRQILRRMGEKFRPPKQQAVELPRLPNFDQGRATYARATDGRGAVADQIIANRAKGAERRAAAAAEEKARRAAAPKGPRGQVKRVVENPVAATAAPKPQGVLDRVKSGYNYGLTYSAMHPYRAGAIAAGATATTGATVGGGLYATNRIRNRNSQAA